MLPLSDFLTIMLLLRDSCLRAWRSPVDILSFGVTNSVLARSNLTSSRKVSRATDGWTGGFQSDLRTVPTIVIAHTFCASPDTRISYW